MRLICKDRFTIDAVRIHNSIFLRTPYREHRFVFSSFDNVVCSHFRSFFCAGRIRVERAVLVVDEDITLVKILRSCKLVSFFYLSPAEEIVARTGWSIRHALDTNRRINQQRAVCFLSCRVFEGIYMEAVGAIIRKPTDIRLLEWTFVGHVVVRYYMYFSRLAGLNIVLDEILIYPKSIARVVYRVKKRSFAVFQLPSDKDVIVYDFRRPDKYYI